MELSKKAVHDRQLELEAAADRYEVLLRVAKARRPDFAALDEAKLVMLLAECRLCLCQMRRAAWQVSRRTKPNASALGQDSFGQEVASQRTALNKVRALYQTPVVSSSTAAVQGQVRVLMELSELLVFDEVSLPVAPQRLDAVVADDQRQNEQQQANAMTTLSEAIRLCYAIADEATEAALTERLQQLQREATAAQRLDKQQVATTFNADKQILEAAFAKLVGDTTRRLGKHQLAPLARVLSPNVALRDDEVDTLWQQIRTVSARSVGDSLPEDAITFAHLWRWWLTGDTNDSNKQQ